MYFGSFISYSVLYIFETFRVVVSIPRFHKDNTIIIQRWKYLNVKKNHKWRGYVHKLGSVNIIELEYKINITIPRIYYVDIVI